MELDWIAQSIVPDYYVAEHQGYRCSVIKVKPWAFFVLDPRMTLVGVGVSTECDHAKISCKIALEKHKGSR